MDSPQAHASSPVPTAIPSRGLFGTKVPSSIAFLIGILLFLLPFVELRCNGAPVANNTGFGLVTGQNWKEAVTNNIFGNSIQDESAASREKMHDQAPNKFAIVALALGALGLIIALIIPRSGGALNLVIGVLAAASLIAMLFDLKSQAKSENAVKSSDLGVNTSVGITVDGTTAFYFTVILFVLAGIFAYMRGQNSRPS